MSNLLPIVFTTSKPYVASYIIGNMPQLRLDNKTVYGKFLLRILARNCNERGNQFDEEKQEKRTQVTLYITPALLRRHAQQLCITTQDRQVIARLNYSQEMEFTDFVAKMISQEMQAHIAVYIHFDKSLKRAINYTREKLGISEEDYNEDAIRRNLHRLREANGKIPRIYNKPVRKMSY